MRLSHRSVHVVSERIIYNTHHVCLYKPKTAYEMRISDWSSDVCSSDLPPSTSPPHRRGPRREGAGGGREQKSFGCLSFKKEGGPIGNTQRGQIGRASCRERVCQYV